MMRQTVLLIATGALFLAAAYAQGIAPPEPPKSWTVRVVTNALHDGAEMSVDVTSRGKVEARREPRTLRAAESIDISTTDDPKIEMSPGDPLVSMLSPLSSWTPVIRAMPTSDLGLGLEFPDEDLLPIAGPGTGDDGRRATAEAEITEPTAADVYRNVVALLQRFTLGTGDGRPVTSTFLSVRLTVGGSSVEVSKREPTRGGPTPDIALGRPDTQRPPHWLDEDYPEVRRIFSLIDLDNMDFAGGGQLSPVRIGTAAKQE